MQSKIPITKGQKSKADFIEVPNCCSLGISDL